MPAIRLLPTELVNQIAAGEVLERPSSAVKELMENALDAGASRIVVDLQEGGRELISIVDDGCGIPKEQLPLAVASHATSKLTAVGDLFRVRSLGFRGEALASIAGVSELTIRSRPADQEIGAEISVSHGIVGDVRDCGCPPGTQIEVRDLFGSVPVRRKFLKSRSTEMGHAVESATRLALAFPGTSITVRHNGRTLLERPAGLDPKSSIGLLLGEDVADGLLPISAEAGAIRLEGFACHPNIDRPNNRGQYFFVNNRWFRDRSLSHALQEAYRGLVMTGRYPAAVLFLDVPPEDVDVNVHPQKHEVRFVDPHRIFSLVLGAVRSRFLASDLTGNWTSPLKPAYPPAANAPEISDEETEFELRNLAPPMTQSLWNGRGIHSEESTDQDLPPIPRRPIEVPPTWTASSDVTHIKDDDVRSDRGDTYTSESPVRPMPGKLPSRAIQLHNSYIVVETDEGMLLVDQHALHERILYEELKSRVLAGSLEAQELLVPEIVELTGIEIGLLLENRETLERLGLQIDEFGDKSLAVRSQPVLLQSTPIVELLRTIAAQLDHAGSTPNANAVLDRILSTAACKAAVKAGDPLTSGEMEALLARRHLVEDSHHCPHGRPTVLRFTLQELERQFKRT